MGERKKRKFSNPISSERGCYSETAPVNLATLRDGWIKMREESNRKEGREKYDREGEGERREKRKKKETIVVTLLKETGPLTLTQGDTWRERGNMVNLTH